MEAPGCAIARDIALVVLAGLLFVPYSYTGCGKSRIMSSSSYYGFTSDSLQVSEIMITGTGVQSVNAEQTFSVTCWQKRPGLIPPVFTLVVGCMANRQIARSLGCAPSTVAHHIARLGRPTGPVAGLLCFLDKEVVVRYTLHHNCIAECAIRTNNTR
jgi:hypothetical protein